MLQFLTTIILLACVPLAFIAGQQDAKARYTYAPETFIDGRK